MSGSNLETRSLVDELRSFDSGGFFDLGHPLLNRMTESFIRAAGVRVEMEMLGAATPLKWGPPRSIIASRISELYPKVDPHLSSYDNVLGFGLDVMSGDHKLVSLQYYWNEETDAPHYPCLVSVYTSGTESWRHFEDVDLVNSSHCAYRSLCNTYLNGFYYWLMEFNDADVAILAFDMSSDKFREIKVPDSIKSKEGDLTVYGDSIALLSCDLDRIDKCVDVWIMKKEGCWSKSLTVGPFLDIRWPLGFWKKDELLLETGSSILTLYNVSTKKLRTIEARRKENGFFIYWEWTNY